MPKARRTAGEQRRNLKSKSRPVREPDPSRRPSRPSESTWLSPRFALGAIIVLTAVCYFPLLRYFFAQDDFMLLYASTNNLGEELGKTFGPVPYHFRPLTEYLYFAGAYKLFGFNPVPYHIVSLVLHLCNTGLMYLALRGLRVSSPAALVATALFGMSVAWLHVVGWITCIQQLLPQTFTLFCVIFTLSAIRDGTRRDWLLSVAGYVLTLFSYEQQALLPVLLFLIAVFGLGAKRLSIREAAWRLWPHFLILGVYGAVRVFYKGLPEGGRAEFVYGTNILDNLMTYLGAMIDYWPTVQGLISWEHYDFRMTHILLIALLAFNLQAGRWREVVFGMAFVFAMILPALFLVRHYYYYHTYATSLGAIYLVALALDTGVQSLARFRIATARRRLAVAAIAIMVIAALSFLKVKQTDRVSRTELDPYLASFVLQRATMAKRAYDSLMEKAADLEGVRLVQLQLGRPGQVTAKGYAPFIWALAHGQAVNMFYNKPDLEVSMDPKSDIIPATFDTPEQRLFFYDMRGFIYTVPELIRDAEKRGGQQEQPGIE